MEQRLSVLVFLTGLVPFVLSASHGFTLIEQGLTWSEAEAYCQANHIDLVNIESAADTAAIQNLFLKHNLTSSAWIGLHSDILNWRWSMDNSPLGSFTEWDPVEPNNNGGNQLCVAVYSEGWWDAQCWHSFHYMCFDATKTGTDRYIFVADNVTWSKAQSICRANYTDLVTIRDAAEYSIVRNLSYEDTWVGLYRDGWKWTNVTNTFLIDWDYDQPDNYNWDENCGTILNGLAADEQCTMIKPFICSAYPRSKQMIQLKVESNQDVNDPAVKAAILEKVGLILHDFLQIKQKLIILGLPENIKVTWKEQDGVVFKKLV